MKVSTNDNKSNVKHQVAPIPFYGKTDDSLSPGDAKTPEQDRDATVHEVRYDPADADSQTHKVYLSPFIC